ncbi:MAG: recombination protein RecR [Clostridia bacterium]|nr:recombination protein RecR [Clostridia bacterium]MBO7289586.1 recombination protein RecR [Clostridia bacterium]
MLYTKSFQKLIDVFRKMPGVGNKSAVRMAYYVLSMTDEEANDMTKIILDAKEKICYCKICQNTTEQEICEICSSSKRDKSIICVVEQPKDVIALEKTGEFSGTYHVLHGCISPMDGIGPEDIKIKELLERAADESVKEIIMAISPNVEGDATSMYISRLLKPFGIKITRIAYGIPVGGDLEYADQVTLAKAIEGRREI